MSGPSFILCLIFLGPIPFQALGLGAIVIVLLTLFHGVGLYFIIARFKRRDQKLRDGQRHPFLASCLFGWAVFLMLMLHIVEIWLWAIILNGLGLIPNMRDALYFTANDYTTLGYGQMLLPRDWRELGPIIAISGLFTFAFTTSALFKLVGDYHDLVQDLALAHKKKKDSWTAEQAQKRLVRERDY